MVNGIGHLVRMNGIIKKEERRKVFEKNLKLLAEKFGFSFIFQHKNHLKHASFLVMNKFQKVKVNVTD